MHTLAHILGLDSATGPYYLWWSGAAGVLLLPLLGLLALVLRRLRQQEKALLDLLTHLKESDDSSLRPIERLDSF